ncbi:hypothetical protein MPTK1_2g08970 [Marchantia polymorpha subsp. ruderalis]|uniref:Uncharacterized protein n=1 Tax=Marchantia polymorpha TaxID=3197 RepID=A0A2R6XH17_MARPO|nr:hypothetical protein MARPO_0015s0181 [Marchantia polymorpha]BBN01634.1 hypothetical protein Mp_2g08970 [Marchantia polymorpha subsp. ruderalis]|eukprot:PTQ45400.1 hypothetical protein MARPO_0015s0181 [Marchantia polymorpha]
MDKSSVPHETDEPEKAENPGIRACFSASLNCFIEHVLVSCYTSTCSNIERELTSANLYSFFSLIRARSHRTLLSVCVNLG